MKKTSTLYSVIAIAFFMLGCGTSSMNEDRASKDKIMAEQMNMADSISAVSELEKMNEEGTLAWSNKSEVIGSNGRSKGNEFMSSSAAVVNKDTARKFVRTADMKFRVKDVRSSTFAIEDIAARFEGFVVYTNLWSGIDYSKLTPVSSDSSLETIYYTVTNEMSLRVPNINLDTTLKQIAKQIDYLDYRIIKADDVTLQLLANKLTQQRLRNHQTRLIKAIDEQGKKLNQTTDAEENLLNKQEMSDNAQVEKLKTEDEISYSTIKLNLYQRPTIRKELVENDKDIEGYRPGFGQRVKEAIKTGWTALEYIIIFLFNIWPLYIVIVMGFVLYRRIYKSKK